MPNYALRTPIGYLSSDSGRSRVHPLHALTCRMEIFPSELVAQRARARWLREGLLCCEPEDIHVVPSPLDSLDPNLWWIDENGTQVTIGETGTHNLELHDRETWVEVCVLAAENPEEGREVLGQFVLHRGQDLTDHQEVQPSEIGL